MEHFGVSDEEKSKPKRKSTMDNPPNTTSQNDRPDDEERQQPKESSPSTSPTKLPRIQEERDSDIIMSIVQDFIELPEHQNVLVSFYSGSRDSEGRQLSKILKWSDEQLEYEHDYIQWLFPLPEPSMVNSRAPLLDKDVFAAFHHSPELVAKLKDSFVRMLDFYGFKLTDQVDKKGLPLIIKTPAYNIKSKRWLMQTNHNHLRISRIIRCLRILCLESEAAAFYKTLEQIITSGDRQVVSCRTAEYWRRAAERQLNLDPNLPEDVCHADREWKLGHPFLKEYAKLQMAIDLQKDHDHKKVLAEEKEAAWFVTKREIDAEKAAKERRAAEAALAVKNNKGQTSKSPKGVAPRDMAKNRHHQQQNPPVSQSVNRTTEDSEKATHGVNDAKDRGSSESADLGQKMNNTINPSVVREVQ